MIWRFSSPRRTIRRRHLAKREPFRLRLTHYAPLVRAPKAKEIGPWLWHGLNAASLAQWLWSLGGGAVVTALLSALLHLPAPWSFVFAAGAFLLAAAAILTLLSQPGEPKSAGPRQTTGRSWTGQPPTSAPPKERESDAVDRSGVQGHSRRVLLGAPLALLAIAMVVFLVAQLERDGSSVSGPDRPSMGGRAEAASEEMVTNARYNLSAGLRVANRSYDDRWATHIRADPTDHLALALTLENKAPVTSYPLVLWTNYEQDPEAIGDYRVRLLVATANGAVLLKSPWVYFHPWTNQVEDFQIETGGRAVKAWVSDPDGDLLRTVKGETGTIPYLTPVDLRSPYQGWADHLPVGPLASGQRVLVEFGASWNFLGKAEFGTTTPTFGIEGRTGSDTLNTGSVRVGDRVTFTALLDNQGTIAFPGHLRVGFQPRKGGRYILMRLYGSLWEGETLIGTATINSADGRPIALIPQPGSTEVWSHPPGPWIHDPDCPVSSAPIKKRVLEDGITLGGVDIGDFGGFTPHGNCAGVEFNEQLHFKATVVPR